MRFAIVALVSAVTVSLFLPAVTTNAPPALAAGGAYLCAFAHPTTDCVQETGSPAVIGLAAQGASGTLWAWNPFLTSGACGGFVESGGPWCPWGSGLHSLDTMYAAHTIQTIKNSLTGDCLVTASGSGGPPWVNTALPGNCESTSGTNGLDPSVFVETPESGSGDRLVSTEASEINSGNYILCVSSGSLGYYLPTACTTDKTWELINP